MDVVCDNMAPEQRGSGVDVRPQLPDYQLTAKPLLSCDALKKRSSAEWRESLLCFSFTVFNYRIALWKLEGKTCLEALGHPQKLRGAGRQPLPLPSRLLRERSQKSGGRGRSRALPEMWVFPKSGASSAGLFAPPQSRACEEAAWLAPTRPAASRTLAELLPSAARGEAFRPGREQPTALRTPWQRLRRQGRRGFSGFNEKMWQVHRVPTLQPHLSPRKLGGRPPKKQGLQGLQSTPWHRPRGLPCPLPVPRLRSSGEAERVPGDARSH